MKRFSMLLLVGILSAGSTVAAEESEPRNVLEIRANKVENPEEKNFYYIELAGKPSMAGFRHVMTVRWQDAEQNSQVLQIGIEQDATMRLIRASEIPNAVTAPKEAASAVVFDMKEPGIVRVRGMKQGTRVEAYATDGRAVATAVAAANGEAAISLKAQARGMYVISVNRSETFKILKP